jgi:hypothetical protein
MINKVKLATFAALSFTLATALACTDAAKPPTRVANQPVPTPANAPRQQPDHDEAEIDKAPRISLEEAKRDFDNKAAVFIDTHPKDQFELEHIPGAINIQANTIKQNLGKVPKGKKIIVYCS